MLTKMVLKMLFKATIPIVLVGGVISYGIYMRGGDPAMLFKTVLGGSFQSAKSSMQGVGNSLQSASPIKSPASKTTVYQWVDENGVTQFGSTPPDGVATVAKTYNNNANLMTATPVQRPSDQGTQMQRGLGPDGKPLPGVAGMNLPVSGDPAAMEAFIRTLQQPQQ